MNEDWKDVLKQLQGNQDSALEENENSSSVGNDSREEDKQRGPLTVVTDRKGRNGKTATIIEGFTLSRERVEDIARKLKQKLGVGGSVRDGEILIQGDHKEAVKKFLQNLEFKIR